MGAFENQAARGNLVLALLGERCLRALDELWADEAGQSDDGGSAGSAGEGSMRARAARLSERLYGPAELPSMEIDMKFVGDELRRLVDHGVADDAAADGSSVRLNEDGILVAVGKFMEIADGLGWWPKEYDIPSFEELLDEDDESDVSGQGDDGYLGELDSRDDWVDDTKGSD